MGRPNPKDGGPLVATKPPTLDQTQPVEYGYDAENPAVGRDHVWDDLSLGMGRRIQQDQHERTYHYAIGADCSVMGMTLKGPQITTFSPATKDATNGVVKLVELGGVVYSINGRYVTARVSDSSWTTAEDLGAGNAAVDAAVITNNSDKTPYLYVGMGDSVKMWRSPDGSTWTQHATMTARAFMTAATWFWVGTGGNAVKFCDLDADTWVAGNYSAAYTLGDSTYPITRMAPTASSGYLFFKQDGIYTLDPQYIDHNLYPFLRGAPDPDNGKAHCGWLDAVYVGFRDGFYRVNVNGGLEQIGPERLVSNASDVQGRITACAGHDTQNLYAAVYNEDSGNSYLLKFGAWVRASDPPEWFLPTQNISQRVEAWHGSISQVFSSKKITAMLKSTVGAPSGHARMYLGFSDGTVGWFVLPCNPNPAACSHYVFTTQDASVYLPQWHGMFINDPKALESVTATGVIDTNHWIEVAYRTDQSQPFVELGMETSQYGTYGALELLSYGTLGTLTYGTLATPTSSPILFNAPPRQMVEFPSGTQGALVEVELLLKTNGTGTPQLNGLGMRYAVRPYLRLIYEFLVLCDRYAAKRDGSPLKIAADQIRALIRAAAGASGAVTIILPDETSVQLGILDYQETVAWDERLRRWTSAIQVKGAEYLTTPGPSASQTLGTYTRLGAYTYAQLGTMTYQQLTGV